MKELGHENRVLDYLKVDTDKGDGTGFEDVVNILPIPLTLTQS